MKLNENDLILFIQKTQENQITSNDIAHIKIRANLTSKETNAVSVCEQIIQKLQGKLDKKIIMKRSQIKVLLFLTQILQFVQTKSAGDKILEKLTFADNILVNTLFKKSFKYYETCSSMIYKEITSKRMFLHACKGGTANVLSFLLKNENSTDMVNTVRDSKTGRFPLHWAVINKHYNIVSLLLPYAQKNLNDNYHHPAEFYISKTDQLMLKAFDITTKEIKNEVDKPKRSQKALSHDELTLIATLKSKVEEAEALNKKIETALKQQKSASELKTLKRKSTLFTHPDKQITVHSEQKQVTQLHQQLIKAVNALRQKAGTIESTLTAQQEAESFSETLAELQRRNSTLLLEISEAHKTNETLKNEIIQDTKKIKEWGNKSQRQQLLQAAREKSDRQQLLTETLARIPEKLKTLQEDRGYFEYHLETFDKYCEAIEYKINDLRVKLQSDQSDIQQALDLASRYEKQTKAPTTHTKAATTQKVSSRNAHSTSLFCCWRSSNAKPSDKTPLLNS